MKLVINKNTLVDQPENFIRRAGYGFITDRRRGTESFVRRLSRDHYPRLHMYIDREGDNIIFNLHIDQKAASYPGAHKHNAEYEGPVVESEMERIKFLIDNQLRQFKKETDKKEDEPKGWWKKIFS